MKRKSNAYLIQIKMDYGNYEDGEIVEQQPRKTSKQNNVLSFWGNENTMNMNPLILTNIQGSSYFKVNLFKLKTYHEVVDEIYYQVRGVGAGGIVSSAYCLLYKLYTLKLTRKQVNGLMNHGDSPYIRGLGFMYIRYTQPPGDLFDWYSDYLQDDEEIDVKAGGGQVMTIGQMLRLFLTKLDWFSTLFPRIPVPIQKQIEQKLQAYAEENGLNYNEGPSKYREEERYDNGAARNMEREKRSYEARSSERYGSSSYTREDRDDRRRRDDRYERDDRREPERTRERYERRKYSEDRTDRYVSKEKERSRHPSEEHRREKYDKDHERRHRDDEKHSRHRSKEKKKHKKKHKHHSRSRSRSHERLEKKSLIKINNK
uniref:Pre-mRNA-splicing factor 38 n=1 Tax=Culicoides sonorensis TaxID=179676 RepID=A0A336MJ80_CULSO